VDKQTSAFDGSITRSRCSKMAQLLLQGHCSESPAVTSNCFQEKLKN